MRKRIATLLLGITALTPVIAQRLQQPLGRGVVAVVRNGERSVTSGTEGKLVTWRRLANEDASTVYNVYQNGQ